MLRKTVNERVVSGIRFRIFSILSHLLSDSQVGVAGGDRVWKLSDHGLPTFDGIGCSVGGFGFLCLDRLKPEIDAPSEKNEDQHHSGGEDFLFMKCPKYFGIKCGERLRRLGPRLTSH